MTSDCAAAPEAGAILGPSIMVVVIDPEAPFGRASSVAGRANGVWCGPGQGERSRKRYGRSQCPPGEDVARPMHTQIDSTDADGDHQHDRADEKDGLDRWPRMAGRDDGGQGQIDHRRHHRVAAWKT